MAKIAGFFVTKNTVFQMTIDSNTSLWNICFILYHTYYKLQARRGKPGWRGKYTILYYYTTI